MSGRVSGGEGGKAGKGPKASEWEIVGEPELFSSDSECEPIRARSHPLDPEFQWRRWVATLLTLKDFGGEKKS